MESLQKISIVIPFYNEEENVSLLVGEIAKVASQAEWAYEIILVDDASTDSTWDEICKSSMEIPTLRGYRHSRNLGQSAALWTGFSHSEGLEIATLDGDIQNDPADLPKMRAYLADVDFICGFRHSRKDTWTRKVSSAIARWFREKALSSSFKDTGCAIRVFRKECLRALFCFNGLHRFMPILVHRAGFKTLEIPVSHRQRIHGVSKYGVYNRAFRGLYDLVGISWYLRRQIPTNTIVESVESADNPKNRNEGI